MTTSNTLEIYWFNWQAVRRVFKRGPVLQRVSKKNFNCSYTTEGPQGWTHGLVSFYKVADIYQIDCYGFRIGYAANIKDARIIATTFVRSIQANSDSISPMIEGAKVPPDGLREALLPIIRSAMEMGKFYLNIADIAARQGRL